MTQDPPAAASWPAVVQAVSSVLALVVTSVLAVLTGRYVALTKQLAGAASEQAALLRQTADADKRRRREQLRASIDVLLDRVELLPPSASMFKQGQYDPWPSGLVDDFVALGRADPEAPSSIIEAAAQSMRYLEQVVAGAHEARYATQTYFWQQFKDAQYQLHRTQASRDLRSLQTTLSPLH
jgi:hypothetical protein